MRIPGAKKLTTENSSLLEHLFELRVFLFAIILGSLICLVYYFFLRNASSSGNLEPVAETDAPTQGTPFLPERYIVLLKDKPADSSKFDIYIREDVGAYEIVYIEKSSISDTLNSSTFFLHVFPTNPAFLMPDVKKAGYFNLDFSNNIKQYIFK